MDRPTRSRRCPQTPTTWGLWLVLCCASLFSAACGSSETSKGEGAHVAELDIAPVDTEVANKDSGVHHPDLRQDDTVEAEDAPGPGADMTMPDTAEPDIEETTPSPETHETPSDEGAPDSSLEDIPPSADAHTAPDASLGDIPFNPSESPNDFEHLFHQVEQPLGEFLLQSVVIPLPEEFVSVEAQISIRGDLDNFPGAFMTFMVEFEGKLKQCENLSGMPQKPNHILDAQFRIAFPRPENIYPGTIYYPPSPPYDFQPVPCADWFQGKTEIEIGMVGIGIYPPGEGGNQGPKACGGGGCTNDAIVKLRFIPPPEASEICVPGEVASCFCPDGTQSLKSCLSDAMAYSECTCATSDTSSSTNTDAGGVEEPPVYGSCEDPATLELSATSPSAEVTLPGTVAQQAWPAVNTPCPTSKPADSIETFYNLTLHDYGILHVTMPDYDAPWDWDQYYLDLQAACGLMGGLDCGASKEPIMGIAQPGSYLIALTQAPTSEIYIPEQTDWSFTLRAELTPLEWSQESTVFSGSTISLSLNNAKATDRDSAGRLHVVWTEQGVLHHGVRDPSGIWLIAIIDTESGGAITRPTVIHAQGLGMLVAWEELSESGESSVFVIYSNVLGMNWSEPLKISSDSGSAHAPTLMGYTMGSAKNVLAGWHEDITGEVWTRTWNGVDWALTDWQAAEVVDQTVGVSRHITLSATADDLLAAWEDEQDGATRIHLARKAKADGAWSVGAELGAGQENAPSSLGKFPNLHAQPNGAIYLAYEYEKIVRLVFSTDDGQYFSSWGPVGVGRHAQLVGDADGRGAIAWTQGQGSTPGDGEASAVGLALTPDNFTHLLGGSLLPGSGMSQTQSGTSITFRYPWLDVFWVETEAGEQILKHRTLQFL